MSESVHIRVNRTGSKLLFGVFFVPDLEYSCVKLIYDMSLMCLDSTCGSFNPHILLGKKFTLKMLTV